MSSNFINQGLSYCINALDTHISNTIYWLFHLKVVEKTEQLQKIIRIYSDTNDAVHMHSSKQLLTVSYNRKWEGPKEIIGQLV